RAAAIVAAAAHKKRRRRGLICSNHSIARMGTSPGRSLMAKYRLEPKPEDLKRNRSTVNNRARRGGRAGQPRMRSGLAPLFLSKFLSAGGRAQSASLSPLLQMPTRAERAC